LSDPRAVLVFDGDEAIVDVPTIHERGPASWIGHSHFYDLDKDGELNFIATSAEAHYLFEMNRACRWDGTSVKCLRSNGNNLTFVRAPTDVAMAPATEEQRVWLAAAQHVLANESAGTSKPGPLVVRSRTSFPGRAAVSQLQKNAKQEFCGQSREGARSIVYVLNRLGGRERSVRDVFANRPEFSLTDSRPKKGDYVGLSEVLFHGEMQSAYLNVDISGRSGSIVKMEKKDGAWQWAAECATWISW
jgi:hypothetical protein